MSGLTHLPADLFGLTEDARALLSGRVRDPVFLPRHVEELSPPVERFDATERAALVARVEKRLSGHGAHVTVLDALRSLRRPGALVVATGAPTGLILSPLATVYRAVHALRLAQVAREHLERPVVAWFWNLADARVPAPAAVINPNLDVTRVGLASMPDRLRMLSRLTLTENEHRLGALHAALAQLLRGAPHLERALELVPRAGETFAGAATRGLTDLFGERGLVVAEPDWLREDLSRALARSVDAGEVPAVAEDEPLAYRIDGDDELETVALHRGGDGFRYAGEAGSRTGGELAAEIVQAPHAYCAADALWPLVSDRVLPVLAVVGDWREMEWRGQDRALRTLIGPPGPAFVPRLSCTLVDPGVARSLSKLGFDLRDVLGSGGESAAPLSSSEAEPAVVVRLRELADRTSRDLEALRAELAALDPSFRALSRRAAGRARDALLELALKVERVHANRTGKSRRHLRRVNSVLLPEGRAQETVLSALPYLATQGTTWIEELLAETDPLGREHVALHL